MIKAKLTLLPFKVKPYAGRIVKQAAPPYDRANIAQVEKPLGYQNPKIFDNVYRVRNGVGVRRMEALIDQKTGANISTSYQALVSPAPFARNPVKGRLEGRPFLL